MDFWPNLELPDLAEHSWGLPQDPPPIPISHFSWQLINLKICFQPCVPGYVYDKVWQYVWNMSVAKYGPAVWPGQHKLWLLVDMQRTQNNFAIR